MEDSSTANKNRYGSYICGPGNFPKNRNGNNPQRSGSHAYKSRGSGKKTDHHTNIIKELKGEIKYLKPEQQEQAFKRTDIEGKM